MCTATYFDFICFYCPYCCVLQLEMHARLICAIKFYLVTYFTFTFYNAAAFAELRRGSGRRLRHSAPLSAAVSATDAAMRRRQAGRLGLHRASLYL